MIVTAFIVGSLALAVGLARVLTMALISTMKVQ